MVKDTVLYIVRHGESMGNLARRLQGQTDFPLSPLGEEQAALAAQRLAGEPLSAVYASPLKRAHRTAQIDRSPFSRQPRWGRMPKSLCSPLRSKRLPKGGRTPKSLCGPLRSKRLPKDRR